MDHVRNNQGLSNDTKKTTYQADPIWPEAKGYLALPQGAKFFQGEVKAEPLIRDVPFVIPVYRAKSQKNRDMIPLCCFEC